MLALTIPQFGVENLALVQRPEPAHADAPLPGQVVVRVRAISLNYRDLLMVKGLYDPKLEKGRVPCSDGAGEVVAVGAGVKAVKPGDLVVGSFFQNWADGPINSAKCRGTLGGDVDGMAQELVVLPEHGVAKAPAGWSAQEAATLPCAALTAWNALFATGPGSAPVQPGESVLVQGTGGVSMFALQLAKAAGCRVIVTSSSDAKLAKAKALGADGLINYGSTPDWEKPARDLSGGGVDSVIEVGGSGTLNRSLKAARTGGVINMIGVLSGGKGEVETIALLMRALTIRGIYVGSQAMLRQMIKAIETSGLRPVIDQAFEIKDAQRAFAHLQAGAHFGKIVIALP